MPPALAWMIGLVVVSAGFLFVMWRNDRKRTEALRTVAGTAGLSFEPKGDLAAVRAMGDVQLFARGHSKRVTNLMVGRLDGQQMAVFDYQFTVGSGKSRHTTVQTVVLLPSAKPSLPDLQLTPENPLTRFAEKFGYQDIDLESSPEFSRRYVVRGADEAAIRAALHPGATAYFAAHEGWSVEALSGSVSIYRANSQPKPQDLRAFIDEACAAARSL